MTRWPLLVALAFALTGAAFAASVPVALAPGDTLSASCAPGFVAVTVAAGEIDAVCPTLTPTATATPQSTHTPTATATATSPADRSVIWIYNPGPMHAQVDAKLYAALAGTPVGTPIAEQTMVVAPRTTAIVDSWDVADPLPTPPWIGVAEIDSNVPVTAVSEPGTPIGTPIPEGTP